MVNVSDNGKIVDIFYWCFCFYFFYFKFFKIVLVKFFVFKFKDFFIKVVFLCMINLLMILKFLIGFKIFCLFKNFKIVLVILLSL